MRGENQQPRVPVVSSSGIASRSELPVSAQLIRSHYNLFAKFTHTKIILMKVFFYSHLISINIVISYSYKKNSHFEYQTKFCYSSKMTTKNCIHKSNVQQSTIQATITLCMVYIQVGFWFDCFHSKTQYSMKR